MDIRLAQLEVVFSNLPKMSPKISKKFFQQNGRSDAEICKKNNLDRIKGILSPHQRSNEKRAPGWLFDIGDEILPNYMGISSYTVLRIPINQPVFHGK